MPTTPAPHSSFQMREIVLTGVYKLKTIKYCLFFIVIGSMFSAFNVSGKDASSLENPYIDKYPFDSVEIHYLTEFTQESAHGKTDSYVLNTILYIQDGMISKVSEGRVPARDTESGYKDVKTIEITTPEYFYSIDMLKKEGVKIDNARKFTIPAYDELTTDEKKEFHERMKKTGLISFNFPLPHLLGKKVGTEKILGRECDVYENKEIETREGYNDQFAIKTWLWQGTTIPLKGTQKGMAEGLYAYSFEKTATKVEENTDIPKSKFELPSDVTIKYDDLDSEFAKKEALRRFKYYKTGEWASIKMQLEPGQSP